MKKLLLISIIISFSFSISYSDGYKLYKNAKKELRKGNNDKANKLFANALKIFETDTKSSQAILKSAELYCNGWGVETNKEKAREYLNKAKKLGVSFVSDKCLEKL